MWYYLAQALGIIVTVLCIINPLFKKKEQMLACMAIANAFMAINIFILNDFSVGSAIVLNVVCIAQAVVNYIHTKNQKTSPLWEKIFFSVLYIGGGFWGLIISTEYAPFDNIWLTLLEFLPIVGALLLMLSLFAPSAQTMRKFSLGNALVWSVYTAILLSTSFFAQLFSLISTCIALYKYREKSSKKSDELENNQ